jgi:uncharacterized RDD family membrane protein YckC
MKPAYASLIKRIQSTFLDMLFIVLLMVVFGKIIDASGDEAPGWVRFALFFGLWALYEPLMVTMGGTLGNRIMSLRVRKHSNPAQRISILHSYLRYLLKFALGWISFVTINTNEEMRAIHDFAAGSVVLDVSNRSKS